MRSTGTVTCNDLEAESSAVFSTVMGLIVRESTLSLTSGSIWTAPRQSLHCVLPGPQPAIAPPADPSQHSAALPGPSGPLGDSILRILVCSIRQAWWRDVSGSSGQDVYAVGFIDAGTSLKGKFSLATKAPSVL